MANEPLSRRSFLVASGGLALGAVIHVALPGETAHAATKDLSALTMTIDPYSSPMPQRVTVVLFEGPKPIAGPPVRVALTPPGGGHERVYGTKLYKKGLPKPRGVYVFEPVLDRPGPWVGKVLVDQGQKERRLDFAIDVKASPEVPTVGQPAPRAASATTADPLGVNPLCTRDPMCPLHTTSLSSVIGTGKPVAVMFATPALCQTATCGPVLDQLLAIRKSYEERIALVHAEIYRSNKGVDVSPTVKAWNLPGEPWLFTINGQGIVTNRLDGAFGRDEMKRALDTLV
jgi:hypothetical protein